MRPGVSSDVDGILIFVGGGGGCEVGWVFTRFCSLDRLK